MSLVVNRGSARWRAAGLAVWLAVGLAGARGAAAVETIRVPVSRDTWISAYPTEVEGNNGAAAKVKLKGLQEMSLVDIDPAPLEGKRVVAATLHLHLETPTPLSRVTVSAVADEWEEGSGTGYARVEGATSYAWARTGVARWGGAGPDVTSVSLAARGIPWGFGDASPPDDAGWQVIPVAPVVIEARAAGRSHGFLVIDDVGSEYDRDGDRFTPRPFPNRFFTSRDGARAAPLLHDRRRRRPPRAAATGRGTAGAAAGGCASTGGGRTRRASAGDRAARRVRGAAGDLRSFRGARRDDRFPRAVTAGRGACHGGAGTGDPVRRR
jgi:hypothetical protein